ncbi:MAG: LysR family substrate-binding domain-containing protein [Trebonia sp.]
MELTPAGERYLERARVILASVNAAGEEAARAAAGELGRVSIGYTGSATYDLLPSLARVLRAELPGIDLDLKCEMLTPAQVSGLLDKSLDLKFLRPPVRHPGIDIRVLRREPLIAVLPAAHPLAAGPAVRLPALRDEPFITYSSLAASLGGVRRGARRDARRVRARGVRPRRRPRGRRDQHSRVVRRRRARRRPGPGVGPAPRDHGQEFPDINRQTAPAPPAGQRH